MYKVHIALIQAQVAFRKQKKQDAKKALEVIRSSTKTLSQAYQKDNTKTLQPSKTELAIWYSGSLLHLARLEASINASIQIAQKILQQSQEVIKKHQLIIRQKQLTKLQNQLESHQTAQKILFYETQ